MLSLLERQAALAELAGLARRAARGAGRVVLLRGQAGVGKTAVIDRLIAGLDQRARVLRGWCDPLATPRPLGPLVDMLAELTGEQAARLRAAIDAGDSEAIYGRLVGVFGNGNAWVCVIEDMHWADSATLDLLRFLVRRVGSLPLLLVVSYRDDEIGSQHPLAVALGDVATSPAVTRIELDPLSPRAVAVLAAGSGVNAAELHRLTGGNPFYVTEILAAGPSGLAGGRLPRSVSEAVWGRLARLSIAGRETAHAVAVCGPRASPALVEAVCPAAAVALAECFDAGVLVADADTIGFRHELARRATVDQIPEYQRPVLHKQVLTVLAAPPIDPNALAGLAFHADQARDGDAVLRHGPAAAERAATLGAHREAADLYALVLRHADTVPAEQKVVWLEGHASESYLCGRVDAAAKLWREAIALRHDLGDRLAEGDDLRRLSHLLWPLGRATEATQAGIASLRVLETLEPCPQLAWSLANLAELSAFNYDPDAGEYAARAATLGAQLGESEVVIRAHYYAALATVLRTDTGWETLEAAWRQAMGTAALAERAEVLGTMICWAATLHHDVDRADRYITETTTLCRDRDLGAFHIFAVAANAGIAMYRGDWAQSVACADDVLTRSGLTPLHRITPLLSLALIRARRGEQPIAPLLDEALTAAVPANLAHLGAVWAARAEAAWLAGDDDTARAEAQTGLTATNAGSDPWVAGQLYRWAHLPGEPPDAATGADPVTPYQLEISGHWRSAAQAWSRRGCPYDAAIAQLGGDIAAVESALATFRRLGARAAARRAQQRLAALRGRTPCTRRADTLADPDGLTRRQREVLGLLTSGRSDAEIAAALHISPKTAGCHVSSILAKLGVDNRIQAAAHALQRQTTDT